MRLICGVFRLDGAEAGEALLRAMLAQMDVPRLAPAASLWREGPVGLAVLDFAARGAAAPALAEAGATVMAADVRFDEPESLARNLGFKTGVAEDTLLLAALQTNGPSGLNRLLGDFAFASWDRDAERLTCGRDIFGIRPFSYVYKPGEVFAFASFGQALHGSGIVPKIIDEEALARRMVYALRFDDSLIMGISRLAPAHVLEVSREGISLRRYWQLDRAAAGTRKIAPEEAARELRRLVDQAVRCRLPPGGEIGAHLSGGLDSSAVAVLAARRLREEGRTLHAYSFLDRQRNDITLEDESEFVGAVLEQEGDMDWTPIRPMTDSVSPDKPMDADKMVVLEGGAPENQVCARAEAQGVGIILSGWGGDEGATFNGRGTFAELFLHGRWPTLARELSALCRERGWPLLRTFYGEVVSNVVPDGIRNLAKRMVGRKSDRLKDLFPRTLSADARARLVAAGDEGVGMAPDGCENRRRLMTSPHIAERAEVWAQIGARHGLAFAFPLLDRRVVEFALSLPSALFLRGGFRRRPFRDAMADVLPSKVRLRHQKYMPFPGHMLDLAESKDAFIARIAACEKNARVSRLMDLGHLRREVGAFPSPELARKEMHGNESPAAAPRMIAVAHALAAAAYLEQHGGN